MPVTFNIAPDKDNLPQEREPLGGMHESARSFPYHHAHQFCS
jgi:hypothetical protein